MTNLASHSSPRKLFLRYGPDVLIILLLILLPLLFFWRLLTPKPEDRLGIVEGDFTEQYFPLRAFTAREWVNGRVPLWNPALFGGQPALADPQSGALYPPHVLQALVLGWRGVGFPVWALEQQMIAHFSIAGVGAYLLGLYWAGQSGVRRKSARLMGLVLALTFTYSGYLTGFPVQQVTILQVSAWLPWVMLALSRTLDMALKQAGWRVTLGYAAWTGLAFALAILAGHPQTVMYIFYLSLAYALFAAFRSRSLAENRLSNKAGTLAITAQAWSKPRFLNWQVWGIVLAFWAISLGLGGMIAAAQLWPTLEFIRHSLRVGLSFQAVSQGLPLSELVSILYPGYFGGSPEYVGILPLVLIAVALVLIRSPLRPTILFWLGVGLLAMLLAFGSNTFLYPLFYLLAPGFDAVRQQERVFLLYSFAAATLAGYGALALSLPISRASRLTWQTFQRNLYRLAAVALALTGLFIYGATASNERGDEVNLFFGVLRHHIFGLILLGGCLLLLALRPRRLWRRWWGTGLVAGWIMFNLFSINWQFNLAPPPEPPLFTPVGTSLFLIEHAAAQPQPVRIASAGLLREGNNAASVFGLEDVTGNTPLQLANVADFTEKMPAWRYWQLMNVLYVVSKRDIDGPGLARRYEAEGIKVFEVGDPFPRARVVHQIIAGDDFMILAQDETDLKTTALISPDVSFSVSPSDEPSTAFITTAQPGYLAIEVEASGDGLLALSQIDYPGWQATLDGSPTKIYRTNGIFQGVFVPSGQHQVVLTFAPASFRWGGWISLIGLLLVAGFILIGRRKI
jgi:hypothetical protein